MARALKHKWTFASRFRARAFGWKSQPAITRVKEAVSEIRAAARSDAILAADGAVLFIERLVPAIEQVDGSSGAIGTAVNRALEALTDLIASAPADISTREQWLDRLLVAMQDEDMGYLDQLGDSWGAMCVYPAIASRQADALLPTLRLAWSEQFGYFKGTSACLSALLAAQRYDELIRLLENPRAMLWSWRVFGVRALAAMGRADEAIAYAENTRQAPIGAVARECEAILLAAGRTDEAYERYALDAGRTNTYIATFRAIAKKYPQCERKAILADLIASTPGEEGKWFATAVDLKLHEVAAALADASPCDPLTLNRAAERHQATHPGFACAVALASLKWMSQGYGYELTGGDAMLAVGSALKAARVLGREQEIAEWLRGLASRSSDWLARCIQGSLRSVPSPTSASAGAG